MRESTETRKYFDFLSAMYDVATADGAWTPNIVLRDRLESLSLASAPELTYLDLGSGTGQTIAVVHDVLSPAVTTGVDFSQAMTAIASEKFPEARFEVASIPDYIERHSADRYDVITAIGSLEFVADLPAVLGRLGAMLTSGGHLLITFEPVVSGLSQQSERKSLSRGQFGNSEAFTTYRWTPGEVFKAVAELDILSFELFRSYDRGTEPVVYCLMVLRAPRE